MYVHEVDIHGIKGFTDLRFDFSGDNGNDAGWCVVTGDNGSGKTTLLKCIALAVAGPEDARQLLPDSTGWVSSSEPEGEISVEIYPDHTIDKTEKGGYPTRSTFWAELGLSGDHTAVGFHPINRRKNKRKGAINGPWSPTTGGWLTLAYGPFRRMYGNSPEAQRLMVIPGRIPRLVTLFKEDATLLEGESWINNLNYKSLEGDADSKKTLETVLRLLSQDFLRHGMKINDVDSNGIHIVDAVNRGFTLADMSEGYRSALAMLIDILRHMVQTYGIDELVTEAPDGQIEVVQPAVVLIDEIDAHLHPEWQSEIGFWLTRHFPRVQFIVTTHSPMVCQAASDERIFHIPAPGFGEAIQLSPEDVLKIKAGRPDQILLTPAFGLSNTRSKRAVRKRKRYTELKARNLELPLDLDEERELEQLELFVLAED